MTGCGCVVRHSPANPTTEKHHSPPSSYPLKEGGKRVIIILCSSAHGIQHRLLNEIRAKTVIYSRYSQFHRDLAKQCLDNTDLSKPIPRTLSGGIDAVEQEGRRDEEEVEVPIWGRKRRKGILRVGKQGQSAR